MHMRILCIVLLFLLRLCFLTGVDGGGGGHEKGDAASQLRRRAGEHVYARAILPKITYPCTRKAIHVYTLCGIMCTQPKRKENGIKTYTVRELRAKLKEALDLAEQETIAIKRGDVVFYVDGVFAEGKEPETMEDYAYAHPQVKEVRVAEKTNFINKDSFVQPAVISVDMNNRIIDPADALNLEEENLLNQARQYQEEVDNYNPEINQDPDGRAEIERKRRWLQDFWMERMQL